MTWDYQALCPWVNWAEEGQGSEGGTNEWDNCVPAATLLVLNLLGYGDPMEPQDITNEAYGSNYHGVESLDAVYGVIRNHPELWANPPVIVGAGPSDPAAWIEAQGEAHKPVIYYVTCDANANIVPGGPYGHACVPVAGDGQSIRLWANGFGGGTVTLSHSQINAVNFGGGTLFDRAIQTQGGAFMALSDAEQSELLDKVRHLDLIVSWIQGDREAFVNAVKNDPGSGVTDAGQFEPDVYRRIRNIEANTAPKA